MADSTPQLDRDHAVHTLVGFLRILCSDSNQAAIDKLDLGAPELKYALYALGHAFIAVSDNTGAGPHVAIDSIERTSAQLVHREIEQGLTWGVDAGAR